MEKQRLIDAPTYRKILEQEKQYPGRTQEFMDAIEVAIADIADMPTVDAVEVVHAKWEKDPEMCRMNGHIYDYRCSHCHALAEKGCYNNHDKFTNYCPNCGAKMDLEDNNVD